VFIQLPYNKENYDTVNDTQVITTHCTQSMVINTGVWKHICL